MYLLRLCQGEPVCVMCAALHRLVTLGTVLIFTVRRAQSFVTERAKGYNIFTSAGQHLISLRVAYGLCNSVS